MMPASPFIPWIPTPLWEYLNRKVDRVPNHLRPAGGSGHESELLRRSAECQRGCEGVLRRAAIT